MFREMLLGTYRQVQERSLPARITTNHLIFTQILSPVTAVCWSLGIVLPAISAHRVVNTFEENVSNGDFNACLYGLPSQTQRMLLHYWELDMLSKSAYTFHRRSLTERSHTWVKLIVRRDRSTELSVRFDSILQESGIGDLFWIVEKFLNTSPWDCYGRLWNSNLFTCICLIIASV